MQHFGMAAFAGGAPVNSGFAVMKGVDGVPLLVMKTQPTASDVHVNTPLTMISVAYIQNETRFVASRVFPNIPVSKQSDLYFEFDRGFMNRSEMVVRAPGTETRGIGYKVDSSANYYCNVYGLHHDVADAVRANADAPLNPDRNATQLLTLQGLLTKELKFVNNYFKASVWTYDRTGVASAPGTNQFLQWNDAASTPIEDIRLYKRTIAESTGFEPNKLVLGRAVWDALLDHPDIVDRIKGGATTGQPAVASMNLMAQLFEIEEVLVANAIQNTAAEGQTATHSFIAGKGALLCYSAPQPGVEVPSAGYTFSWNGLMGASAFGTRISRFRMEHLKSDRIEIEAAFDMKKTGADLGCFLATAVA